MPDTESLIPTMEGRPEPFNRPPIGDVWRRRTRTLALDAAARACGSLMRTTFEVGQVGGGTMRGVPPDQAAEIVLTMARAFEKYLDGEQAS